MNTAKKKTGIPRLLEFSGAYKGLIILSCILSGVSAVLMLGPYVCLWFVAREALYVLPDISAVNAPQLVKYAWWAVALAISGFVVYFAALMSSHIAAFHTARNMKSQVLRHLVTLPMGFFTENTSGKLRKIIDENSSQTESFLAHQLPDITGAFITPVVMLALLLTFDWRLGLLCLVPLAAGFAIQMQMMKGDSAGFMKKYQDALEDMNHEAVEYVRGIPVVKVFQQTVYSFKSFYSSIMQYKKYVIGFTLACKRPMTAFMVAIHASFAVLIPAGILLINHAPDYKGFLLDLIFYIIFTPACAGMLNKIMYASTYKMIAEESVRRLDTLFDEKPLEKAIVPKNPKGAAIKFDHVTFTYAGNIEPALSDISFTIPQGKTVALVGSSGGGKSTVASLIPRFHDVDSGCVTIGGVDIRLMEGRKLMEQVAFVFQSSDLFKASILENIRAARPDASDDEVMKAVQAAQCSDLIAKLPDGIHTVIGTKGVYLSGGEKQRVALARAIVKDAPVIVLDEATAFTDPENEHKIQLAFEELTRGKTVLLIAHRLSTVQNADRILVVDNGKIKEQGTHKELLSRKGMYASMWEEYKRSISWSVGKGKSYAS